MSEEKIVGPADGYQGQGAAIGKEAKKPHSGLAPGIKLDGRRQSIPSPESDWRMIEDPEHPGAYIERVITDGKGKRLNGN